jgi:signal transduction histidine kinase
MKEGRQEQRDDHAGNLLADQTSDTIGSHELRTPLTSIMGYAELILNDPLLGEEARKKFAQIIFDESQRLSRAIAELCRENNQVRQSSEAGE